MQTKSMSALWSTMQTLVRNEADSLRIVNRLHEKRKRKKKREKAGHIIFCWFLVGRKETVF